MSILKVNDASVSEAYSKQKTGGTTFYVADELPLTISEALDKPKYYFVGDSILFTITLALTDASGYSTLDTLKLTDQIPTQVTIGEIKRDNVVIQNPSVVDNLVTIEDMQLDAVKPSTIITIAGTINKATA